MEMMILEEGLDGEMHGWKRCEDEAEMAAIDDFALLFSSVFVAVSSFSLKKIQFNFQVFFKNWGVV